MKRLLAVKASAGSGKTFRLANRYIALLSKDIPSNVVAITFTNKAANEMKERIIKFLRELGDDKNVIEMIKNELNISKNELLDKKEELLKRFLTSDINIQTIDSFINKILRKFSYFAGVRSSFRVGEVGDLFDRFLETLSEDDFKRLIEFARREEKFSKLIEFFNTLYEKDKELKDIEIKVKEFDETKAKEAFRRFKEYILNHPKASSRAVDAVSVDFYEIYKTTWFSKESMKEYQYFKKKGLYEEWFEDVLDELKRFFKDYFDYVEAKFLKDLFYFYEKYKAFKWNIKKEENLLSFKDIEHLVYDLLKSIRSDFLYFRLDSRVNHFLLDEFQDTSITQWEILEPLVSEIASGIGRREFRSFFYVGDTKQAIYRFRGGEKALFDEVARKYKPFGLEIEELKTNYRSAKNIVDFVNEKFDLEEKANRKEEGYVEVDTFNKEEYLNKLYEKIEFLNQKGVKDKDIAILVYKNDDILEIGEFLHQKGKKVVTAKSAKVISQRSAKAIISLMKYLNDNSLKIELLNFLSLIGKKWGEVSFDIEIDRPVKMIKEIMDKFGLIDEASLKLLYHSKEYDTLIDFVEKIDSYEEELPLKEFDGIVVMTIHKSKGLEFNNVIVLDSLSDKRGGKNIIYSYDGLKLKEIKLVFSNRELVDKEYEEILKKEELLEFEDSKNIEYVAFTRAKNSLIILKRDEVTKDGKSKSAFVTKLSEFKIGEVIPSEDEKKEEVKRVEVDLRNYGHQELRVKEEEYKPNDFEAIYLGNAIHYAFECGDLEAVRNRYGDFCNIDEVREKIEKSKPLIPNGKKEVPFIFNGNVGRIDLLVEGEEILIIDYKSTRPNDERAYIKQVRSYVEAVEKITGKKAKGKLFYVDEREFKEVK